MLARSCRYQGWPDPGVDTFIAKVLELRALLGIPHGLAGVIPDDSRAEHIGEMATQDTAAPGNPVAFSAAEYAELFRRAYAGAT